MKWKLSEASSSSNLQYRNLVDCEHFVIQKKWIGSSKVRIVTKSSIGSLVICTAPAVSELWDVWEICTRMRPQIDAERHIIKESIAATLRPHMLMSRLRLLPKDDTIGIAFPAISIIDSSRSTAPSTSSAMSTEGAISSARSAVSPRTPLADIPHDIGLTLAPPN